MDTLSSASIDDLETGGRVEHYRLLERIGHGGQAVVWSAYDAVCRRVVACKFDEAAESGGPYLAAENEAFVQQARLLTTLTHPHILPVYDYGLKDRLRFVVMPYLPGGSLKRWLEAGRLPRQASLQVMAQACLALDYLHRRQIIHRDLKSTNILVDVGRNIYLSDFGLARMLSDSTRPLHTGRGTPPYAPPEQHMASALMPQSDIYSLGVLFYELLTGELPWHGEKILGLLQITEPAACLPDPRELNPEIPVGLVAFLRSLTAAQPVDRPASASETVHRLQAVLQGEAGWEIPALEYRGSEASRPVNPRRSR